MCITREYINSINWIWWVIIIINNMGWVIAQPPTYTNVRYVGSWQTSVLKLARTDRYIFGRSIYWWYWWNIIIIIIAGGVVVARPKDMFEKSTRPIMMMLHVSVCSASGGWDRWGSAATRKDMIKVHTIINAPVNPNWRRRSAGRNSKLPSSFQNVLAIE